MKEFNKKSDYISKNSKRYTEIANFYKNDWRGEQSPELQEKYNKFLTALGSAPQNILDVGCGTGKASNYFATEGYCVACLDISQGMLNECLNMDNQHKLKGVLSDMRNIPFEDKSFDGIWSMASVVHLSPEDRKTAMSEFSRVLNEEGLMYLSVQNLLSKKHIKRVMQSYLYKVGYDSDNRYYRKGKTLKEFVGDKTLIERLKRGYAELDDRYWYYPTIFELKNLSIDAGFEVIDASSIFSKRIDLLLKKK